MNVKQLVLPVERGCDPEGCFKVVDRAFFFALGSVDIAKNAAGLTDKKFLTFLWKEFDSVGCCLFRLVELIARIKQPSEGVQTPCLLPWVTKPLIDLHRLLRMAYPLLVEAKQPTCIS